MKKVLVVLAIIATISSFAQQCGTRLSDSVYFNNTETGLSGSTAEQHIITVNCYDTYLIKVVDVESGDVIQPVLITKQSLTAKDREMGITQMGLYRNNIGREFQVAILTNMAIVFIMDKNTVLIYQ